MRYVAMIGVTAVLAGCVSGPVRNIDASGGKPSKTYSIRADGSMFIGATSAGVYIGDQLAAIVARGETVNVMLPCGKQSIGVKPPGGGEHSFRMQALEIDPCDGGQPNLHINFEPYRGFFLTREA